MSEVEQLGRLGVGAGDDQRRRAHHVGGEPRGIEVADMRGGRDQHLAAEMAALLFRRELVLVVDAGRARLDERLHDLEGVERAAEAGFGVGDDRREPGLDRKPVAFRRLDLVGALQRAVDALGTAPAPRWPDRATGRDTWPTPCWRRPRPASPRGRSPSGRRGPSAWPGCRDSAPSALTKSSSWISCHSRLAPISARRMPDLDRAAQPLDVVRRVGPLDAVEAALRRRGDKVVKISHHRSPVAASATASRCLDAPSVVTSFTLQREVQRGIRRRLLENKGNHVLRLTDRVL